MPDRTATLNAAAAAVPPHAWFGVSAVFHYLGPAFAVLLFPAVGVLGVAWFRIATAAVVFASYGRPLRTIRRADRKTRALIVGLGICFALMNTSFYFALDRLPMSLVAAMEFIGTIAIALYGARCPRNLLALALAVAGVVLLIDVRWSDDLFGLAWSSLNALLFAIYVLLGHRAARTGAGMGVETLGAAMLVAFALLLPVGFHQAALAMTQWRLVLAGVAVGLSSSVVPYICDQLAMARLPRASFALLLTLLPASATVIAAIILRQIPTPTDIAGVLLVMTGIAIHRPRTQVAPRPAQTKG